MGTRRKMRNHYKMKQKNSTVVIKLMGIRDEYVIGLWGVFLFSACFFGD